MNYYNYFTEIEDTFIRRRGRNLFLSPLDWALIEAWQDRGIPLHVVIRSIESVFDVYDKQPPGTRVIKTLFYCREEVEVQYLEWLTAQTGRGSQTDDAVNSQFSIDVIEVHIADAIAALEENPLSNLREELDRAGARLKELSADLTGKFETIDKALGDVERVLDRAMLEHWEPAHLKAIKKDVSNQLRPYKAEMDAASYQNTYDLMLLKRLREEAGIPRLGLFYL